MNKRKVSGYKVYLMIGSNKKIDVAHIVNNNSYLATKPENDSNIKYDKLIK